jgi:hypothetical protein
VQLSDIIDVSIYWEKKKQDDPDEPSMERVGRDERKVMGEYCVSSQNSPPETQK